MSPESLALIVAAVLGSSGLASLFNSQLQWARTARLKNLVEQSKAVVDSLDPGSRAGAAAVHAMDLAAAEYAALLVVRRSPTARRHRVATAGLAVLFASLATIVMANGILSESLAEFMRPIVTKPELTFVLIVAASVGYYVTFFAYVDFSVVKLRERFIVEVIQGKRHPDEVFHNFMWRFHGHVGRESTLALQESVPIPAVTPTLAGEGGAPRREFRVPGGS